MDDERALVDVALRGLPLSGYLIEAFTEPVAALDVLDARPDAFDALITDLAMPLMNGFALITAVRAVRPDLPVVLTSGLLTREDWLRAARAGVTVVPKPCSMDELAHHVGEAIRKAAAA